MKNIFRWTIVLLSLFSLSFISCKDDDDDKIEEIKSEEPKKVLEKEFRLGNQYSKKPGCFCNLQSQSVTSDTTANFDFAFVYCNYSANSALYRYFIASPNSNELEVEMKMENVEYECRNETAFYKLPSYFSESKYDTLTTVAGLKSVIAKSELIYNEDHTTDCIYSDRYGWASGEMFGFQLASGKCGIIKIVAMPTDYKKKVSATCILSVKWEGED